MATTAPEDIADYTQRLGDAWKIGRREVGDGALVVAKDDHRLRIATAKAVEGAIPDVIAGRIIEQVITPRLRQGDFAGGLMQESIRSAWRGCAARNCRCRPPARRPTKATDRAADLPVRRPVSDFHRAAAHPGTPARRPGFRWGGGGGAGWDFTGLLWLALAGIGGCRPELLLPSLPSRGGRARVDREAGAVVLAGWLRAVVPAAGAPPAGRQLGGGGAWRW